MTTENLLKTILRHSIRQHKQQVSLRSHNFRYPFSKLLLEFTIGTHFDQFFLHCDIRFFQRIDIPLLPITYSYVHYKRISKQYELTKVTVLASFHHMGRMSRDEIWTGIFQYLILLLLEKKFLKKLLLPLIYSVISYAIFFIDTDPLGSK